MVLPHWLSWVLERAQLHLLSAASLRDYAKLGAILAITLALEMISRKNWRLRYGSRNFRVDLIYYVFYYSGLYHILIFAWMYRILVRLVAEHAPFLQLNLLSHLPPALQVVTLIVAADFLGYWMHRLMHSNRVFWAFHSIHHSQTTLTAVTNYRFHVVDETLRRLILFIPSQILGVGVEIWLLADFLMAWILLVQHSEWDWTYGPLGRVFVSPVFHRKHHSTDFALQNSNFSMLFTFWDDLFGTAERQRPPPTEYGLAGNPIPERFFAQLIHPFVEIARGFRQPQAVPAVLPSGGE